MRYLLIFFLLFSLSFGCNGNQGRQPVQTVTIPQPGTAQPFDVVIYNGSQYPIVPDVAIYPGGIGLPVNPGQVLVIPPGTTLDFPIGFLPSQIVATAFSYGVPPLYQFPIQVFNLGTDFGFQSTSVTVSFY